METSQVNKEVSASLSNHIRNQNNLNPDQLAYSWNSSQRDKPLPSQVQIVTITPSLLPSYRRLITLLLPIKYPESFYKESVADPSEASLARVAIWNEQSVSENSSSPGSSTSKVVGGIQCRLENSPSMPPGEQHLYIQTIAVLAPFRQLGIATHLLDSMFSTVVKHYERVTSVYAHVWEANQEALEWYERRGFVAEGALVKDYYRRLKPSGARVVRRRIGVGDHLKVIQQQASAGG